MPEIVEAQVEAGKATPGPPLGPALGPLGVNIVEIIKGVNEQTKAYTGMVVPVKIIIADDKSFTVEVGTPPTSALIKKELGIDKGSGNARESKVGNLTIEQVAKIAEAKGTSLQGSKLSESVKEILGTCVSMGITVDDQDPRDVQTLINDGKYEAKLPS